MENANSHDYLHKIKTAVIDNIRRTGKPSVEAFLETPGEALARGLESDDEDEEDDLDADRNPDKRVTQRQRDAQIDRDGELYDPSDDEEYKENLGVRRQPGAKRRRNIMDYQNPNAVGDDGDEVRALNGESARSNHLASPAPDRGSVSRASSARPTNGAGARSNGTSSRARTPVAADEDGDVDMDEPGNASPGEGDEPSVAQDANAAATAGPSGTTASQTARTASSRSRSPAGVVTPPESPPQPATGDDVEMDDGEGGTEEGPAEESVKAESGPA